MVYQETSLVPSLTVAQNLYLARRILQPPARHLHRGQQFLQSLNFHVDPTRDGRHAWRGQKQMVEIARAVHHNAQVIIFDEPTATLTPEEKKYFFDLVQRLKERGVSIIFISHALEEALRLPTASPCCATASTSSPTSRDFDRERSCAPWSAATCRRRSTARTRPTVRPAGEKVLSVQNLRWAMVRNNSFSVFAGQITGVFGLIGSGRTETAKVVAGVLKRDLFHGGQVRLDGGRCAIACRAGGARRHRLRHRGPQARRLLRDHVDRRNIYLGLLAQAARQP